MNAMQITKGSSQHGSQLSLSLLPLPLRPYLRPRPGLGVLP